MKKRIWENFVYVYEDQLARFLKPVLVLYILCMAGFGILWGFRKVDAYLTPPYAENPITHVGAAEAKQAQEGLEQEAFIAIPKIGTGAPITFVQSTDPAAFIEPLEKGVAHYPSSMPGEKGLSIILGHSAPPGWFGNKYDGVFSGLKDLEEGDVISVTVGGTSYTYRVTGKEFLQRGQDIPEKSALTDSSRLVLLSCWPPGINNKRIMVQADVI